MYVTRGTGLNFFGAQVRRAEMMNLNRLTPVVQPVDDLCPDCISSRSASVISATLALRDVLKSWKVLIKHVFTRFVCETYPEFARYDGVWVWIKRDNSHTDVVTGLTLCRCALHLFPVDDIKSPILGYDVGTPSPTTKPGCNEVAPVERASLRLRTSVI